MDPVTFSVVAADLLKALPALTRVMVNDLVTQKRDRSVKLRLRTKTASSW